MIEIEELTKRYGAFTAVDGISFQVEPGQVLGFLGPNGAGKSTTMKMIAGFLTPTSGRARVCGHDVEASPLAAKRMIGYLPEGAPCYDEMTPRQFLSFVADVRGLRGDSRRHRLGHVIEHLHLDRVLDQQFDTLSKGYRRRVGLAQALLHDPQVLILDEPTDGLDPNQKHEVRGLINQLAEDKIVVISTHILEEVEAVCNRAMIIARGKLLADASPAELEAQAANHQAIRIRLQPWAEAAGAIESMPEVKQVIVDDRRNELTVLPNTGQAPFAKISELLQRKGWVADAISVERGRLDDVFRQITQGAVEEQAA